MNDMSPAIIPRSDQLNSDDLISGPRTITIREVRITPGTEQPVSVMFDGDNGKPYKPCKSMSRVMVAVWGPDASQYTGRAMTLYRDPSVKWGGMDVGGIRISHMSHTEGLTMALTATKGSRKPFTIRPLSVPRAALIAELEKVAKTGIEPLKAKWASLGKDQQKMIVGPEWERIKAICSQAPADPPTSEPKAVTYAELMARIRAAKSADDLEQVKADCGHLPQDQQAEILAAIDARRMDLQEAA